MVNASFLHFFHCNIFWVTSRQFGGQFRGHLVENGLSIWVKIRRTVLVDNLVDNFVNHLVGNFRVSLGDNFWSNLVDNF